MENLEIYLDYIGDDSYVYRYNYDNKKYYNTGICLKGNPGNPGRPGRDGKTPHIGTNGDWFIGDVDTGVKAYTRTEVVTQLPQPSEATKNQIYIAPALNPQEGDSYSEYITVYKDGQYKWELLGTKIATMGASGNNHKGGLVPDTPSTAGTTKFLREDGTWEAVDMSGKEDVTSIVAPVNATDATLPITTLTCEVGKYYRIDVAVETLAVTLPAMDAVTSVKKVVIYLTGGTTPAVTISAADSKDVYYQDGYEIEAGKTYEVNALFNGIAWVVTAVEIFVPEPEPITIVYKGDNASATNIMTKTTNSFGDTYTLDEASITKMTLDDNKVTLTDFNIANLGQYGVTCDVYTYTFNDANEHTLKVWTNSSDMFRLSPWFGSPSPSQSAYFSSIKSVVIPNTITTIGTYAFGYCSGLTSITIPDSVTSIGEFAFGNCTSLTSVTIGNSVTSIGEGAFWGCSGLTSIDIPSGVTSIGDDAFRFCSGLTSIDIPSGVTSIGDNAFGSCTSLTSIDIPDSVTSIGYGAFNGCTGLTSVTIGNSVTSIGERAFGDCTSLTSITIPDSVTSIGMYAFESCTGLTSITIGSGVTSIGYGAFNGCTSLTSITSNAMTAPTIKDGTFYEVKTGGTLTVPSGSTGYDVWMGTSNYYLGKYGWTKVEQ